jgi:hypothetical protein
MLGWLGSLPFLVEEMSYQFKSDKRRIIIIFTVRAELPRQSITVAQCYNDKPGSSTKIQ